MKTKAIALDSFAHGKTQYVAGETIELSKSEAEEMRKAGHVSFDDADSPPADDDLEDLVGGDKAEAAPKNKMQPAPANKGKK